MRGALHNAHSVTAVKKSHAKLLGALSQGVSVAFMSAMQSIRTLLRSVPRAEWCPCRAAACTLLDTNSATSDKPYGEPSMCRLPTSERGDPGDAESFRRGFCGTRASAETRCLSAPKPVTEVCPALHTSLRGDIALSFASSCAG